MPGRAAERKYTQQTAGKEVNLSSEGKERKGSGGTTGWEGGRITSEEKNRNRAVWCGARGRGVAEVLRGVVTRQKLIQPEDWARTKRRGLY